MKKHSVQIVIAIFSIIMTIVIVSLDRWKNYDHPTSFEIKHFLAILQPDHITCGPTSALMVLKNYHKNVDLKQVERESKTEWIKYKDITIGMTSPDYLPRALSKFGVNASLVWGDLDRLKHYVSKSKPVILLLRSGEYTWHYVVAVGYDENNILIADPGAGVKWDISNENLLGAWSFKTDMQGEEQVRKCGFCSGTGKWANSNIGPLGICEFCNGTGMQIDYINIALRSADVYPFTMIVPDSY